MDAYSAVLVDKINKLWMVRRWKGPIAYPEGFTENDYQEFEIWGATSETDAIKKAKDKGL